MKIGLKRLLKLAEILDTADALHRERGEPTYDQKRAAHVCGTPACAFGHWAHHRGKRHGWTLTLSGDVIRHRDHGTDLVSAAQHDFGITFAEAGELFGNYGCDRARTAKQAAKYIRRFVARKLREEQP